MFLISKTAIAVLQLILAAQVSARDRREGNMKLLANMVYDRPWEEIEKNFQGLGVKLPPCSEESFTSRSNQ